MTMPRCSTVILLAAAAGCASSGAPAATTDTEPRRDLVRETDARLVSPPAAQEAAPSAEPEPGPEPPTPSDDAAIDRATRPSEETIARLEAIYEARAEGVLSQYNQADVHFMTGMIGHHAQALVMAGLAPKNEASPAIRVLCARIINAQRDEIDVMQRWLRDRDLPVPEFEIHDDQLMVHGPAHAMHMPGMLSAEQLDELRAARGSDFDRLFLLYMIQHHEGAVIMSHQLFESEGAAQSDFIFKLASDIQADQGSEIDRMQRMLDAMR